MADIADSCEECEQSTSSERHFFWEFPGILESFWRILDISKIIFQIFFPEIPEIIFGHISGIM